MDDYVNPSTNSLEEIEIMQKAVKKEPNLYLVTYSRYNFPVQKEYMVATEVRLIDDYLQERKCVLRKIKLVETDIALIDE